MRVGDSPLHIALFNFRGLFCVSGGNFPVFAARNRSQMMLHLHAASPPRWLEQVRGSIPELLLDHAHCEKKAADRRLHLFLLAFRKSTRLNSSHVALCRMPSSA